MFPPAPAALASGQRLLDAEAADDERDGGQNRVGEVGQQEGVGIEDCASKDKGRSPCRKHQLATQKWPKQEAHSEAKREDTVASRLVALVHDFAEVGASDTQVPTWVPKYLQSSGLYNPWLEALRPKSGRLFGATGTEEAIQRPEGESCRQGVGAAEEHRRDGGASEADEETGPPRAVN